MTLQERLEEVMRTMKWAHADLVRVSGQSSSVVSQWLGKGSKTIHTIGKIEAALRIAEASGYSATWIAKGIAPKRAKAPAEQPGVGHQVQEKQGEYIASAALPIDMQMLLRDMEDAMASPRLAAKLAELREEVAEMREFARNVYSRTPISPEEEDQAAGKAPKREQLLNPPQRAGGRRAQK
jgi:hypothetical protein